MEVWVSGLNQHTANVPNRKVPKVRILLLPQEYINWKIAGMVTDLT